jgi:AAA family ATP:ADP antiporter
MAETLDDASWRKLFSSEAGFGRRACITLFLLLAAHAMSETARDALFLSKLPVSQLPWMFMLVAVASIAVARATTMAGTYLRGSTLRPMVLGAAIISWALWLGARSRSPVFLYLLYLWPAVFISVVLVEFWRVVSDAYTITEAKTIFGWIGAAGTAGAAVGSGVAAALSTRFPATALLLVAGLIWTIALAFIPEHPAPDAEPAAASEPRRHLRPIDLVRSDRYLRGIAACLLLATISATLTDFLFKGLVTRDLPPARLAPVFAGASFGANLGALILQLALVGPLIRRLGVTQSLAVLPTTLSVASLGLIGGAGLFAAIGMRIADSTLRYSLQRVVSNLLYVPLTPSVRARVKAFIDVLTQRIGQVAGSVVILLVIGLGGGYRIMAVLVLLLSVATVVLALRLRQPYLDLFRATLTKTGTEARLAYPDLDVDSLGSLVAAFNNEDEREVIAALDLVAEQHEVHVIPVVMLFHPSQPVVLRTLELFEQHRREGFAWALDRLRREADDPRIKAAALSAYADQRQDDAALRAGLDDPHEAVNMAALVGLVSGGWMSDDQAARALADAVRDTSNAAKASLAAAIRRRPSSRFEQTLLELADTPDPDVRARVADAMAQMPSPRFLPSLQTMLSESTLREAVRQALNAIGPPALDFLAASLEDERSPRAVRLHLPRSISRFASPEAIAILWRRLLREPDDLVQRKILRGIGRLVADHPTLCPEAAAIAEALQHFSHVGLRYASWRAVLERQASVHEHDRSETRVLLMQLLADKQARVNEFVSRLLGLIDPAENFERIYRGLHGSRLDRASGHELLENVVRGPARELVLALLDDSADLSRLAHVAAVEGSRTMSYDETVDTIARTSHGVLRIVAARHAAEIGVATAHT